MKPLTTLVTVLALLACASVADARHRQRVVVQRQRVVVQRVVAVQAVHAQPIVVQRFVAPAYGVQQFNSGCAQQFNSGYGVQQFNAGHNCGALLQLRVGH